MDLLTLAGIVAVGAATGLGGLALFAVPRPTPRLMACLLGFTAGVMLAATVFSLLVPGLEEGTVGEVLAGFLAGALVLLACDILVPHAHALAHAREGATVAGTPEGRRAVLLLSALAIHNLPEGLAVGIAFGAGGAEAGLAVAVAIGIQNVPEGFAAAAPLLQAGVSRRKAALVALGTGLVEPPMALLAYAATDTLSGILPFGYGFAAGAMLYVVVDELVPESHGTGYERPATVSLLGGFALLLVLDNALG